MAARSKNKYDVYNWIRDEIIPSIQNQDQQSVAHNLINNFLTTYKDTSLTFSLRILLYNK